MELRSPFIVPRFPTTVRPCTKLKLRTWAQRAQTIQNSVDATHISVPAKYEEAEDLHEYYSGQRVAPFLTIFCGGNHEATNTVRTLRWMSCPKQFPLRRSRRVCLGLTRCDMSIITGGHATNGPFLTIYWGSTRPASFSSKCTATGWSSTAFSISMFDGVIDYMLPEGLKPTLSTQYVRIGFGLVSHMEVASSCWLTCSVGRDSLHQDR